MCKPGGDGRLAIVLHAHMPYVEGFGTWPVGEEWLWDAAAKSYVPLLELLERRPGRVTLSLTPVLLEQLAAPGVHERLLAFLSGVRPAVHAQDARELREAGDGGAASAVELSAHDYAIAAERIAALGERGLARALTSHASWTSAATHAVLPLLATDQGVRLQLGDDITSGFWLPECGYAPWLDRLLADAGVRLACVDLSGVDGVDRLPQPISTEAGPLLLPIDRWATDLVWDPAGYPSAAAYRDSHRRTAHGHRAWSNDGETYDPDRARGQAAADAREFVAAVWRRVRDGGLCVFAIDAELLGEWWHEGIWWLDETLAEADRVGLELVVLDESIGDLGAAPPRALLPSSWGVQRDLSTWSGPAVADIAWRTRSAELNVLRDASPDPLALRELALLQSSDWAFMVSRGVTASYGRERFEGHIARLSELTPSAAFAERCAS